MQIPRKIDNEKTKIFKVDCGEKRTMKKCTRKDDKGNEKETEYL